MVSVNNYFSKHTIKYYIEIPKYKNRNKYSQIPTINTITDKILHSVDHLCKESLFTASVAFQGNCYYNSIYCSLTTTKKNAAWNLINHGGWIWTSQVCACKKLRVWKQKELSLVTFVITQLNHKHPVWARVTQRVLTSTLTRFILYFLNPSPRIW